MQKVTHNGETDVKVLHSVLHSVLCVCWKISIDYKAINEGCLQNPIEMWIAIMSGYELCIKIGSILVSHIHTHLMLVVGINNDRYIKPSAKVQIDYRLRYAQLIASFPWTPARRAAYSHL